MRCLILSLAGLLALTTATAGQQSDPRAGVPSVAPAVEPLTITHVKGHVYLVSGIGPHVTVQVGQYGPIVVDTPAPAQVPQLLEEIRKLSPDRVRWLMHTTAEPSYIAGSAAFLKQGNAREAFLHNGLYDRVLDTDLGAALPLSTVTYSVPTVDTYNTEPIILYQAPAAITDSDTIVLFRESNVVSTGPIYVNDRYPIIDLERGGTIEGLIEGIYKVLELAVADNLGDPGTMVIPGHGRLAEESDVAEYRNMVVMITDRVRDLRSKGMTLEQVRASRPSRDFDAEYNATQADADRFVDSIYKTLPAEQ